MSQRILSSVPVALILVLVLVEGERPVGAAAPLPLPAPKKQVRLVAQLGHSWFVTCVAFSPSGKHVLTGSEDKTARLWDTDTGHELCCFQGHSSGVTSVAFSSDGKHVITGSWDHTARVWDAETGQTLRQLQGHTAIVTAVAFSPDGKRVVTASEDKTARLWDTDTGQELQRFGGHSESVTCVAFSPDGKHVLTGSADKTARLWSAETGRERHRFEGHSERVNSVAFSPDGKRVVTGSQDGTARLWDADTGRDLRSFKHAFSVSFASFTADGKCVVAGSLHNTAHLWDADTGQELRHFERDFLKNARCMAAFCPEGKHMFLLSADAFSARLWDADIGQELCRFQGHSGWVRSAAFSPDGKRLLTGNYWDGSARLWDGETGQELRRFEHTVEVQSAAFSPDGKRVLTAGSQTVRLWDADTSQELKRFEHSDHVFCAVFSPDGTRVLTGSADGTACLWDIESGEELQRFLGHTGWVVSVAFSPDGKRVLTGSADRTARLWDADTGQELRRLAHSHDVYRVAYSPDGACILTGRVDHEAQLWHADTGRPLGGGFRGSCVAFSPDGKHILTGDHQFVRLFDTGTGQERRRFEGHSTTVNCIAFSPDGKRILSSSQDSTTRLWDIDTGRELCSLVSFTDGTWAVVDPEGRFDASNGGDVRGLHWVVGNEPISLDQLKDRYYDPGLLAKYMGFNKEPLRQVAAFADPKLQPDVQLAAPAADNPCLGITLHNRGGGIGRVVVKINGKELTADARGPRPDADAKSMTLHVDLAGDPRLQPGQKNSIEVQAFNAEGYLRSRSFEIIYQPPGEIVQEPPHLWVVVAGASRYRGERLKLRFAAKDAEDIAQALEIAGSRLFGKERVHLTLLTTSSDDADRQPNRANLLRALQAAQKARPDDVLVVYLAGHGINHGGQDGDFYYLTCDAQTSNLTDPEVRKQAAVSSQELTEEIKRIPARKQVLILDTCAAARAIDKMIDKRDVPSSQIRALERVKDRTGLHILAGCAADSVSYEASRYAQGVVTYCLLLGMRGAALRDEQFVDVGKLFSFAQDRVPELARDVGGIQRPVVASPRGAPFDLGQVTAEDQSRIPLQTVRPLLLRAAFQDEEELSDNLGLARRIDELLRASSSRGRGTRVVFVDAREMSDAYQLAGLYRADGDRVNVTVRLARAGEKGKRFSISGDRSKPDELAARVVAEAERQLGLEPDVAAGRGAGTVETVSAVPGTMAPAVGWWIGGAAILLMLGWLVWRARRWRRVTS